MSQPTLIIADDHPLFRAARIVKVWVLPKAKEGKLDRTFPAQTSQEQARRFDEMSRQAREAYEAYVRIHGKPPPGEEEEVTKAR